jgi:hypothetical protein
MTDEQIARLANRILTQDTNLSEEEERVAHDCQVLLGEATSTGEDEAEVRARVRAAFSLRYTEADLDGTLHVAGECCGEGSILGRVCRRPGCEGRLHVQPICGGLCEVCERCEVERDHWRPRGTFLTDQMLGGFGVEDSSVLGEVGGAEEILEVLARVETSGQAPDVELVDRWRASHVDDPGFFAVGEFLRACASSRTTARTSAGEEVRVGDQVRWDPDIFRRADGEVTQIYRGQVRAMRVLDATGPWRPILILGQVLHLEFATNDDLRGTLRRLPRPTAAPATEPILPAASGTPAGLPALPAQGQVTVPVAPSLSGPGLWFVSARHRDTDRARRWVVVAACLGQAYDRLREALRASPRGERYGDHDAWRAWPATSPLAVEVGAGGDVGVDGLS